jgi:hypothetical protein
MHVQVKKLQGANGAQSYRPGVLVGNRTYTLEDGPFEVEDKKAKQLIAWGVVDACVFLPTQAAERAVAPKLQASRR